MQQQWMKKGSLQEERERANERAGERRDERLKRQERKRAAEQGGREEKRRRDEEEDDGKHGMQDEEYGSLRLGASAKAFVSTAGQHGYVCALCRVTLPSLQLYEQHMAGSAHAKAVRALEEERDRQRRGVGSAHDALAGAQWSTSAVRDKGQLASIANGQKGLSTISPSHGRADRGGDALRPPPPTRVPTATAAAAAPAASIRGKDIANEIEEDSLPAHISTRKKKKKVELDLSIDGWLPPLPTVRAIDERLVLPADMRRSSGDAKKSTDDQHTEQEHRNKSETPHAAANGGSKDGEGTAVTTTSDGRPGFSLVADYDDDDDDDD